MGVKQTNFDEIGLKKAGSTAKTLWANVFNATATIDPPSLTTGTGSTSSAISVPGAKFGDFVIVGCPYDMQGCDYFGFVSAADNVKIRIENNTGGTLDLASGTFNIKVLRG